MKQGNKRKGYRGEQIAAYYLKKHKRHRMLEKNFRCPMGEIDLISQIENTVVFTEVKYRKSVEYGLPAQSVHRKKQHHIVQTAFWYLNQHSYDDYNIRFDVVEIIENEKGLWVRHIENAFRIPQ